MAVSRVTSSSGSDDILPLIDAIYDAAIEPGGWPVFLKAFAAGYPGGQGALYKMHGERASILLANWDESWTRAHNEYFFDTNPWLDGMRGRAAGVTNAAEDFVPARDFERCEYFHDFLRPQGLATGVGATVMRDADGMIGVSVLFSNGFGQGATPDQVSRLKRLVPHLQRAMTINQLVGQAGIERASAEQVLGRLGTGVIVTDAAGRCLFVNASAERALASRSRPSLAPGQRLDAGDSALTGLLRRLVSEAARPPGRGGSGGAVSLPRANASDLMLLVTPLRILPDLLGFREAAALVFVVDPSAQAVVREQAVGALLGLTAAQSRVACALARGSTVGDIATMLSVSDSTVRFHLRAIFERTETRRQSDLVRLVLTVSGSGLT